MAVRAATAAPVIPPATARPSRRWLARLSLLLAAVAVVILIAFSGGHGLGIVLVGVVSAAVSLAAAFWFVASHGFGRWLALVLAVLSPVGALAGYAVAGQLWVAVASAAAWLLAAVCGRAALAPADSDWQMPEHPGAPAGHPFLIMNPRSGGGKVARFDLARRAERLGADVCLLSGDGPSDVTALARQAVSQGADLLGAAGGDGTQALVAEVAADHDLPFVVIPAGTRNHFALDLGLDLADPAAALDALAGGVDLLVDLGVAGGRTFVNNASFGAYAAIVQTPAYRNEKVRSTLDLLPDLISGQRGPQLTVLAGDLQLTGPQAVLVANNPYGTGDVAGLSRRPRLDRGRLGVISVAVSTAAQAVSLMRGTRAAGLTVFDAPEVIVDADAAEIPVGVDGEAVAMTTPVRCAIRPAALRVRVPAGRPGVPAPRGQMSWTAIAALAAPARPRRRRAPGAAG